MMPRIIHMAARITRASVRAARQLVLTIQGTPVRIIAQPITKHAGMLVTTMGQKLVQREWTGLSVAAYPVDATTDWQNASE